MVRHEFLSAVCDPPFYDLGVYIEGIQCKQRAEKPYMPKKLHDSGREYGPQSMVAMGGLEPPTPAL